MLKDRSKSTSTHGPTSEDFDLMEVSHPGRTASSGEQPAAPVADKASFPNSGLSLALPCTFAAILRERY